MLQLWSSVGRSGLPHLQPSWQAQLRLSLHALQLPAALPLGSARMRLSDLCSRLAQQSSTRHYNGSALLHARAHQLISMSRTRGSSNVGISAAVCKERNLPYCSGVDKCSGLPSEAAQGTRSRGISLPDIAENCTGQDRLLAFMQVT